MIRFRVAGSTLAGIRLPSTAQTIARLAGIAGWLAGWLAVLYYDPPGSCHSGLVCPPSVEVVSLFFDELHQTVTRPMCALCLKPYTDMHTRQNNDLCMWCLQASVRARD